MLLLYNCFSSVVLYRGRNPPSLLVGVAAYGATTWFTISGVSHDDREGGRDAGFSGRY